MQLAEGARLGPGRRLETQSLVSDVKFQIQNQSFIIWQN
jgi:hypothetical protein